MHTSHFIRVSLGMGLLNLALQYFLVFDLLRFFQPCPSSGCVTGQTGWALVVWAPELWITLGGLISIGLARCVRLQVGMRVWQWTLGLALLIPFAVIILSSSDGHLGRGLPGGLLAFLSHHGLLPS